MITIFTLNIISASVIKLVIHVSCLLFKIVYVLTDIEKYKNVLH